MFRESRPQDKEQETTRGLVPDAHKERTKRTRVCCPSVSIVCSDVPGREKKRRLSLSLGGLIWNKLRLCSDRCSALCPTAVRGEGDDDDDEFEPCPPLGPSCLGSGFTHTHALIPEMSPGRQRLLPERLARQMGTGRRERGACARTTTEQHNSQHTPKKQPTGPRPCTGQARQAQANYTKLGETRG